MMKRTNGVQTVDHAHLSCAFQANFLDPLYNTLLVKLSMIFGLLSRGKAV